MAKLEVIKASSKEDTENAIKLRKSVYGQNVVDDADSWLETTILVAKIDGKVVGTLRVTIDSEKGLPAERGYNFSSYRQEVPKDAKFFSVGMLAIESRYQKHCKVLFLLIKESWLIAKKQNAFYSINTISAETLGIYSRFGFKALTEKFWDNHVNDFIIPIAANVEKTFNNYFKLV